MTTLSGTGRTGSTKPKRKYGLTDIPCEAGCGRMLNTRQLRFCSYACRHDHDRVDDREALLWSRVDKRPDGHWEWNGKLHATTRRGWFNWTGKTRRVDRLIYELVKGEIPPKMNMERACNLEGCFNPFMFLYVNLLAPAAVLPIAGSK